VQGYCSPSDPEIKPQVTSDMKKLIIVMSLVTVICAGGLLSACGRYIIVPEEVSSQEGGSVRSLGPLTTTVTTEPWPPLVIGNASEREGMPFDNLVWQAEIIAEVHIEDVLDTRYNTPDGRTPTQSSTGPEVGLRVFTPIVLRVTSYLKGDDMHAVGFIVPEWGGETDDLTYLRSTMGTLSDRPVEPGVVFLYLNFMPTGAMAREAQWRTTLIDLASERSIQTGETYLSGEWMEYYEYSSDPDLGVAALKSQAATGDTPAKFLGKVQSTLARPTPADLIAYP